MSVSAFLAGIARLSLVIGSAFLLNYLLPPQQWSWRIHDLFYHRPEAMVPPDTQIVIVDIEKLDRAQLAQLLVRLAPYHPAFISIDATFPVWQGTREDTLLMQALCSVSTQIPTTLAATLDLSYPLTQAPKRSVSHEAFTRCVEEVFANLLLYDTTARIVREALLYTISGTDTALSLAARAALAIDSTLVQEVFTLPPQLPIRYSGGLERFYYLSGSEVLRDTLPLSWLSGKVLFLGVADPLRRTMEDIFFSPLNPSFLQRSFPDMYGVVIHANITAMLVHRRIFKEVRPLWTGILIGVAYFVLAIAAMLQVGNIGGGLLLRGLQILLFWGCSEMTLWLLSRGLWLEVEPLFWGILLAAEIELWRKR